MFPKPCSVALLSLFGSFVQSAVFDVDVGADAQLIFKPNTVKAAPGDTVNFHFFPGDHSVAQSSFDSPCMPIGSDAIYSGFFTQPSGEAKNMFQIVVNSTDPIWIYCSNGSHCSSGMSMVINPPASGDTLASYMKAAQKVFTAKSPAKIQGGSIVPNKEGEAAPGSAQTTSMAPPPKTTTTSVSSPPATTKTTPTSKPVPPSSTRSSPATMPSMQPSMQPSTKPSTKPSKTPSKGSSSTPAASAASSSTPASSPTPAPNGAGRAQVDMAMALVVGVIIAWAF